MNGNPPRNYNCKDEELPVICGFVALSLKRDLEEFTSFSPMFTEAYVTGFEAKIDAAEELVQPKSETIELKVITERIYATLDGLISPINRVEGYLELAGKEIPISSADFGLVQLRKSARVRDVENVLKLLRTVEANINKYKEALSVKGLTDELTSRFGEAGDSLAEDKNQKYSLISNRTALVQNNLGQLNELNDQLTEICKIGKVLYKQTDKAKLKDYTFTQLRKQVRRTEKTEPEKPVEAPVAENDPV